MIRWHHILVGVVVSVAVGCSGPRDEEPAAVPLPDNLASERPSEPVPAAPALPDEPAAPEEEMTEAAEPADEAPAPFLAEPPGSRETPLAEETAPPAPTADALPLPPAAERLPSDGRFRSEIRLDEAPPLLAGEAPPPTSDRPLPPTAGATPPAPADGPTGEIATRPEATDEHLVQVFYATDRKPILPSAAAQATWRRFLPTIALAGVTLLAGLGLLFLPRKLLFAIGTLSAAAATAYFGHAAVIEAQGLERAIAFGDRTYGSERHVDDSRPVLELGLCEVSIPPDHRVGRVESPSVLRFEFREDPRQHVVLNRIVRLSDDEFFDALRSTVAESSARQALVFIHGYNVGFDDAVKRTAQIVFDLRFDGAAVCYSWPSHGGLGHYTHDDANVDWTVTQLEGFLRDVAERSGARTVHLVAHSMGNRALVQAVDRLALRGDSPEFGHVILAAPDVDTGEFRTRYAPALVKVARRITLYASSNDRALQASTEIYGHTRAGLSGEHLVIVPGLDTIDVSPIDTSLIGHSYYGDNPLMIRDLGAVIGLDVPADGREWLRRALLGESAYWSFRPELMSGGP